MILNETNDDKAFRLSRIYAKGWNAARGLTYDDSADLDATKIAALNPYRIEEERQRWSEGFTSAAKR